MTADWRPAIRALIYCVQFVGDLTQSVDHVLQAVVEKGALGLERNDYREAMAAALSSTESLAAVIPQEHSEETVRRFLELLRDRL